MRMAFSVLIICLALIYLSHRVLKDEPEWLRWLVFLGLIGAIVLAFLKSGPLG
jgi:hypothetical protein